MKVKLVVTKGQHVGKVIQVNKTRFVIGRHKECNLQVSSQRVSVHHTAILIRDERAWVRDLDSTNGTYLNEARISDEQELKPGDKLDVGPLHVEVQLEPGQTQVEMTRQFSDTDAANFFLKDPASERLLGISDTRDYESTVNTYPVAPEEASPKQKPKKRKRREGGEG